MFFNAFLYQTHSLRASSYIHIYCIFLYILLGCGIFFLSFLIIKFGFDVFTFYFAKGNLPIHSLNAACFLYLSLKQHICCFLIIKYKFTVFNMKIQKIKTIFDRPRNVYTCRVWHSENVMSHVQIASNVAWSWLHVHNRFHKFVNPYSCFLDKIQKLIWF